LEALLQGGGVWAGPGAAEHLAVQLVSHGKEGDEGALAGEALEQLDRIFFGHHSEGVRDAIVVSI
jgi:hypothetical protein